MRMGIWMGMGMGMGQTVDGGWAGCLAKWMGGSNDETSKENKKLQQQWPKGMGQGEQVGGMVS